MAVLQRTDQRRRMALPLGLGAGATVGLTAGMFALAPLVSVGALAITYLLLFAPETGLIIALLARPMLDLVHEGIPLPGFGEAIDPSAMLALILIGVCFLYVITKRVSVLEIPLFKPFAFLIFVTTVTLFVSQEPAITIAAVTRLTGQLALYTLTFLAVQSRSQVERMTAALVGAAILPVLWGFGQIATGNAVYLHPALSTGIGHPRLAGPFGEGLTLGSFLVIPTIVTLCLFLEARVRYQRLIYVALLALFVVALYMTLARGPWLAMLLAMAVLGLARYRLLLALVPATLVVAVIMVPGILSRWAPVVEDTESTTAAGRFERWEGAWEVFKEHPFLGAGLGVGDLRAGELASGESSPAHNDYLRIMADGGIVGLVAYIFLLFAVGVLAVRTYARVRTPLYRSIALAMIAAWAAFMVLRITGNILTLQVLQYYFWSFAAIALALPHCEANDAAAAEELASARQQQPGQLATGGLTT